MTQDELDDIMRGAGDDPGLALVRLWFLLEDQPAFEAAVHRAVSDAARHSELVAELCDALCDAAEPPRLAAADALALLAALDTVVALGRTETPLVARRIVVGDRGAWLVERPGIFRPLFARQPNQMQHWLRRHWILPENCQGIAIHVERGRDEAALAHDLIAALADGELRIHVAGFSDGVEPEWSTPPPRYGADRLTDEAARWRSIEAALTGARADQAHVLVLPELTVTPPLRRRVSSWLAREDHSLLLVLPGTFHVGPPDARRNEAWVLDRYGGQIVSQQKLRPMRKADEIEDVQGASTIQLATTPLGLLGIGIYLDFCEEGPPFNDLWHRLGIGLMLVPSMSNHATGDAHARRALAVGRAHDTITAVAIQPTDEEPADRRFGFVCGPHAAADRRDVAWIPAEAVACCTYRLIVGALGRQPSDRGARQLRRVK